MPVFKVPASSEYSYGRAICIHLRMTEYHLFIIAEIERSSIESNGFEFLCYYYQKLTCRPFLCFESPYWRPYLQQSKLI